MPRPQLFASDRPLASHAHVPSKITVEIFHQFQDFMTYKSNLLRLPSQARALPPGAVALRRTRFALGWSQERMARELGIDVKTYRNRETARVVDPVFDGYVLLLSQRKEAA
jgi:DNA-binding XRE family transcriptional regulator